MKQDKPIDWEQKPKQTAKKPKAERATAAAPETDKKGFIGGYFRPLGWGIEDGQMLYFFVVHYKLNLAILLKLIGTYS
jgi:hypothetical protein